MLKIYSERKKERNLVIKSKYDFLKELDLVVYERDGEYWFQFHDVIESLTKLYLSDKFKYEIKEKKVHQKVEVTEIDDDERYIEKPSFKSEHIPFLLKLKKGLRKWKNRKKR